MFVDWFKYVNEDNHHCHMDHKYWYLTKDQWMQNNLDIRPTNHSYFFS